MAARGELMLLGKLPWELAVQIGQHPSTGLKATGTNKATALVLAGAGLAVFTTVSANTGALLPPAAGSPMIVIQNGGANSLSVYTTGSDVINANSAAAAFTVTNGKSAIFVPAGVNWVANLSA